jgi:acid ceramidase
MKVFSSFLLLPVLVSSSNEGWINNEDLKERMKDVTTQPAPRYSLNLDLPASERWNDIAADYKDQAYKIVDYLKSQLPTWLYPIVIALAADIEPYFVDYGDEMVGLAKALDLDLGVIVATNLVYELERIGVNCSNWNNTGPTLDDDAIPFGLSCADARNDLEKFHKERHAKEQLTGPEGLCTSIVSQNSDNAITHGRNLDWNIPETVKTFVIDLDVYQGGELIYMGTGAVGFVGMLNGMRVKGEKWTVSQDARKHGGRIPVNLVEALTTHALTPEQAIRYSLENMDVQGFDQAVDYMANIPIVTDVYYVMAGEGSDDAAVVTRDRNQPKDIWRLGTPPDTPPNYGNESSTVVSKNKDDTSSWWWLTETNYDHWENVPAADDRRDPANQNMLDMGSAEGVNTESMFSVMSAYPTFNAHTTYTTMMDPAAGTYNSTVWYGNFVG